MKVLTIIIGCLGILVVLTSLVIMKYSEINEERILRDYKDLSKKEFKNLRRKYVLSPRKWAFYVVLTGNILLTLSILFHLNSQDAHWVIQLGVVALSTSSIINHMLCIRNVPRWHHFNLEIQREGQQKILSIGNYQQKK